MRKDNPGRAARGSSDREPTADSPDEEANIRLGGLANLIGFHLRLAQDASFRSFARHTGVRDLKPGRFAAMTVIQNNPGITQADLGRSIARDKSSVTPLIQDLEKQGLVKRHRSPTDRRSMALSLTPAGEARLRRLLTHAMEHDEKLDRIVGAHKPQFIRLLKKIADSLP